ncbi:Aldehyde/histidinol dehydrogenase [Aspergillus parasiticus]|uniref:Aldehyde/histidinol dehydrogenase n=1 Tax=Aspergillus parasiticus TaxID=5067 RepID=A0A5N6D2U1_ASPPA|nr:Aldehyde/histidinol dehydrogenase [Aspergillus parasiticus]
MNQASYEPGSEERKLLKAAPMEMKSIVTEIPSIINGERIRIGHKSPKRQPLGSIWRPFGRVRSSGSGEGYPRCPRGDEKLGQHVIQRCAVYNKAEKLVESPKYRWTLMAASMIDQRKTCGQVEGDYIAEVIDILNFHVYSCQCDSSSSRLDYRPREGFVLAISPFNFTALGAHIAFMPALLGNVILWKSSPMTVLSNYLLYQIMKEAGIPTGIIQFLPIEYPTRVVEPAVASPHFAGLHYTGFLAVLRALCTQIGTNTNTYENFPRIVAESGGKNFHLMHDSCKDDVEWLASEAVCSAYKFQGQKCSALPRDLKRALVREASKMTYSDDAKQLHHTFSPMILEAAFQRFEYMGFFVQPTVFELKQTAKGLESDLMTKELFGPLSTVQIYDDASPTGFENVCDLIDSTSEYALAGSVFARHRMAVKIAHKKLQDSVEMFCINDKSTGTIIGAQPFGGARSSGTNDKANSMNVLRFSSIRCVKDAYVSGSSSTLSAYHVPE